jgi:hypothetical protein
MAKDRLVELFERIDSGAPDYARLSTNLSESISRLESFLNNLPSRIEVDARHSGICIRYIRAKGGWQIQVATDNSTDYESYPSADSWASLSQCNVETKIAAAGALEALLEKYAEIQEERLKRLREIDPLMERLSALDDGGGDVPF